MSKQIGDRLSQISAVLTSVQSIMEKVDKGQGPPGNSSMIRSYINR